MLSKRMWRMCKSAIDRIYLNKEFLIGGNESANPDLLWGRQAYVPGPQLSRYVLSTQARVLGGLPLGLEDRKYEYYIIIIIIVLRIIDVVRPHLCLGLYSGTPLNWR